MTTLADRGESTISMEPLLVGESSRWRATLHDKALELVAASARLDHSLPTGIAGGARPPRPLDELLLQQPHRGT